MTGLANCDETFEPGDDEAQAALFTCKRMQKQPAASSTELAEALALKRMQRRQAEMLMAQCYFGKEVQVEKPCK